MEELFIFVLRGKDLNLEPSGYEPDELPIAPPRDSDYKYTECFIIGNGISFGEL